MKKKISKTNLLKRTVAYLLAAAMVCTVQGNMGLSVKAATEPVTEQTAEEKVLFESDYNDVTDWANYGGVGKYNAAWQPNLAGNVFPKNIDGNGYLSYTQNTMHLGVIRFGHDYKTGSLDYNYVKVKPGYTYVIEYKIKKGPSNHEIYVAKGGVWPSGNGNDLEIGLAVANPTKEIGSVSLDNYKNAANGYTSYTKVIDTITVGSNLQTEWEDKKVTFTVPDDAVTNGCDALQLYLGKGYRCEVSIDYIKITTGELTTSEVLFDTDYETANKGEVSVPNNWYSMWDHTGNFSGDLRPGYLPEEKNTVLYYRQSYYGLGIAVLGHDYKGNANQDAAAERNAIKVTQGTTYKVSFDYKIRNSIGNSDLSIGLAVGKSSFGFKSGSVNGSVIKENSDYVSQYTTELTFAKNTTPDQDWHTQEAYITVPEDADLSQFNTLLLYAKYGGQPLTKDENNTVTDYSGVFFDNIKVTKVTDTQFVCAEDRPLFTSGYDSAYTYSDETSGLPWLQNGLVEQNGDVCGYIDSNDSNNKVLYYRGYRVSFGIIALGDEYKTANKTSDSITVRKGSSYKIDFKWKMVEDSTGNSDLTVGIGLYSGNVAGSGYNDFNNSVSQKQPEFVLENGKVGDDTWNRCTTYYTVDDETDISVNNKLCIYADKGNGAKVFFDDISVTETAGVNVAYSVDGKTTNTYHSDGNVTYTAMDNGTTAVKWYTDAAHTTPFVSTDYTRTGKLGSQTLYGVRDRADITFVKGDANLDGNMDDNDIATMREGILSGSYDKDRADINGDATLDIKDIVRGVKRVNNQVDQTGLTIGSATLESYKVVQGDASYSNTALNNRVNALKNCVGEGGTNTISVKLNSKLPTNVYVLNVKENSLTIEAQSEFALSAALETLLGYLRAGLSVDSTCSREFIYTGDELTEASSLVF